MQIFRSDEDNRICAMHLDDKRLNKIITEVAQIASTAIGRGQEERPLQGDTQ